MRCLLPFALLLLTACSETSAPKKDTAAPPPAVEKEAMPGPATYGKTFFLLSPDTTLDSTHNFIFTPAPSLLADISYQYCGLKYEGYKMGSDLGNDSYIAITGPPENIARSASELLEKQFGIEREIPIPDASLMSFAFVRKKTLFELPLNDAAMKFKGKMVDAFRAEGFAGYPNPASQVQVLYYATEKEKEFDAGDFIVQLEMNDAKEVVLIACVRPEKTLLGTWEKVNRFVGAAQTRKIVKTKNGQAEAVFPRGLDIKGRFISPDIDVHLSKETALQIPSSPRYPEGKLISGYQETTIQLNEKGAELLEEMMMADSIGSFRLPDLYVDRSFLFSMKEAKAKRPYLLMWVNDPEVLPAAKK